jgi:hypothetical protein
VSRKSVVELEIFNHGLLFVIDDQSILYQQVDPITTIQPHTFIIDGLWVLQLEPNGIEFQLVCKALLVCRFQEAWPHFTVDLKCASDHSIQKFIKFHSSCPPW